MFGSVFIIVLASRGPVLFCVEPKRIRKYSSKCPLSVVKITNIKPSVTNSLVDCSILLAQKRQMAERVRKTRADPEEKNKNKNGSQRKTENPHWFNPYGATRARIRVQRKIAIRTSPTNANQLKTLPSSRNGCLNHLLTALQIPQVILQYSEITGA